MRRISKTNHNEKKGEENNLKKQHSSVFGFLQNLSKSNSIISQNIRRAWKQLQHGINSTKIIEFPRSSTTQQKYIKQKKQNHDLIINIDAAKLILQNSDQQNQKQQSVKTSKQSEASKFRVRNRSQNNNHNQLKSLKRTNQMAQSILKEQQKKAERIKQINKRKIQLLQRLRKIDNELIVVKKQLSPNPTQQQSKKKIEKDLYLSSINKSFIKLANSRLGKLNNSQSTVEQHSKALQLLSKLNNDKLKRQQKLAQDFKKKQSAQIFKLQELEQKKYYELEMRRKNYQPTKYEKKKMKTGSLATYQTGNNFKLNQFQQQQPDNQSSLIPTTILQKQKQIDEKDDLHAFDKLVSHKNNQHLLTERNMTQKDIEHNQSNIEEIRNQAQIQNEINVENYADKQNQQKKHLKTHANEKQNELQKSISSDNAKQKQNQYLDESQQFSSSPKIDTGALIQQ